MSIIDEKKFAQIPGLFLPRGFVNEDFLKAVEYYVDSVPSLSDGMQKTLNKDKMVYFIFNLKATIEMLKNVYARRLQAEGERILRFANAGDRDACKKIAPPFITDLTSLSISLQMAQADGGVDYGRTSVETYADLIANLRAVAKLVENEEFDRAREMLTEMESFESNSDKALLIECTNQKSGQIAGSMLQTFIEKYAKKIVARDETQSQTLRKILAVDDRPEILSTLCDVLKDHYKVFAIPNGKTALRFLEKERPELFILDIEMPEMNGYELAEQIRIRGEYRNTPILFLTSNSSRECVVKAMQSGGSDFIVKPVDRETLLGKISRHLR